MKTVHDLNREELEELRGNYFVQLQETAEDVLDGITEPEQIPLSNVIAHYEGNYFVDEDFFCNL